jgi:thymidylate kinase
MTPFVVIEGVNGSGKDSVAAAICSKLGDMCISSVNIKEAGATSYGAWIKSSIFGDGSTIPKPASHMGKLIQFIASMEDASSWVKNNYKLFDIIISRRWVLSTIVYQQCNSVSGRIIWELMNAVGIVEPDLYLLLDINYETYELRVKDRVEKLTVEGFTTISDAYSVQCSKSNVVRVDGRGDVSSVSDVCINIILQKFFIDKHIRSVDGNRFVDRRANG